MNKNELSKYHPATEFLLYKTSNGDIKVDALLQNKIIWIPQKKIAELFNINVPIISKHLKNIFEEGEFKEDSVVSILETTAGEVWFVANDIGSILALIDMRKSLKLPDKDDGNTVPVISYWMSMWREG